MLDFVASEDAQEVIASKVRDNVILNLVNMVNIDSVSVGITIFCKGTIISGDVISGKEYFESMAEAVQSMHSTQSKKEELSALYLEISRDIYSVNAEQNTHIPLNYMHMKNVVVKGTNESFTTFIGSMLRVRIDEIDGHMIGRAAPAP